MSYSLFHGQQSPPKSLIALLSRQIKWDDQNAEMNRTGLHLRFVKIDDQGTDGTTRYRVFAEGAPENKVFSFGIWPGTDTFVTDPRSVYVNAQGLLLLRKAEPEEEMSLKSPENEFVFAPLVAKGEPVRILFSTKDGLMHIYSTFVAHPIVSVDHGCSLEVRLSQPDSSAVLLVGNGFPAKTKVPFVLESEAGTVSDFRMSDDYGHAVIAAFPLLPGKAQGTLKATAEGPSCLPSVTLPWTAPVPAAAPAAPAQTTTPAPAEK